MALADRNGKILHRNSLNKHPFGQRVLIIQVKLIMQVRLSTVRGQNEADFIMPLGIHLKIQSPNGCLSRRTGNGSETHNTLASTVIQTFGTKRRGATLMPLSS